MQLSVMTFNIHKGKHAFLARETLQHIREFLQTHAVDLILLQEVVGANPKKNAFDQVAYLAEGLASAHCYGKNLVSGAYHHGNAILSKYPIVEWNNVDLSTNRYERRGVLGARIDLPDGTNLNAFCSHLNLLRESRQSQLKKIAEILDGAKENAEGPSFLGGDLNDWNRDADRVFSNRGWREVGMETTQRHFATFPAWWPKMPLDRIYYRNARLIEAKTVPLREMGWISDHLPVLASFHTDSSLA